MTDNVRSLLRIFIDVLLLGVVADHLLLIIMYYVLRALCSFANSFTSRITTTVQLPCNLGDNSLP